MVQSVILRRSLLAVRRSVFVARHAPHDAVALSCGFCVCAAQSIVAPLGSLTLVANVMMAPWVLKETVSKRDVLSTLLIVAGCVLAVAFASHSSEGASVSNCVLMYVLTICERMCVRARAHSAWQRAREHDDCEAL